MNEHDEIDLYGKRAALSIARFRIPKSERILADEKVQQWTPWAFRYANDYLLKHPKVARAIKLAGWTMRDVYQAALEGMVKGSRLHKEEEGAFSAYSVWYMRKEIQRLARRRSVRVSVSIFTDPRHTEESPVKAAELTEELELLSEWMKKIPSLYRDILMDHFNGVVQDETVKRAGISKRTLRKYRAQAMEWLRFFAGVGPEPADLLPGMKRYRGTGKA